MGGWPALGEESVLLLAAVMRNPGMVHTLDLPLCRLKLELWQKNPKTCGWKFVLTWWWVQSNISGMCQVKVSALGPKSLMGAQIMLREQVKPCSCSALVTQGRRVKAAPPAFGDCSSCFPASASLVLGCSPKMPKHTDPALTSGPNLFPSLCWSHGH